jgi:hypothetical protein
LAAGKRLGQVLLDDQRAARRIDEQDAGLDPA